MKEKNYRLNQRDLRNRLLVVMKHSGQSFAPIAKEIGIARDTLAKFVDGGRTDWIRLCRIEKYVTRYENYLRHKGEI